MLVAVAVDWKLLELKVLAVLAVAVQEIMVLAQTPRVVRLT